MTIEIVNLWFSILVGSNIENHDCECLIFSFQFVIKIKWTKTTRTKKPIGILNLKLWTEFHLTPLNRYLRPQLSFISEETLIVSSVTRSSPLEMLSSPVNLPCGTKRWREFNIFGVAILLLFCLLSLSSLLSTLSLSLSLWLSSSSSSHNIAETDWCCCKRLIFLAGDLFLRLSGSRVQL